MQTEKCSTILCDIKVLCTLFVCDIGKHNRMYHNKTAQDITEKNNNNNYYYYYYFIMIMADDDGDAFRALNNAGIKQ